MWAKLKTMEEEKWKKMATEERKVIAEEKRIALRGPRQHAGARHGQRGGAAEEGDRSEP
jgi:hypothetical protein